MNSHDSVMRLAIVLSHPTQYYSPWFRHLALRSELKLKVFYLWDSGVTDKTDRSFGTIFSWDIPLLDGYDHEFLENRSRDAGTHHFRGLNNSGAVEALAAWSPDAVLIFGYNYMTHLRLLFSRRLSRVPFLFRGDSHDLFPASGWKSKLNRLLRGLLFCRFNRFLAVGGANAGYFRHSGVAETKIRVAPHCVDNGRFQGAAEGAATAAVEWKREIGIPAGAPVVLFAGKFEDKKRPLDLLYAFLSLPAAPGFASAPVLLFVGNGVLDSKLRETAAVELGKSVYFAPFQNQSAMPKVYASGDVLVLPSYGRGETWGLAVNEAFNLGVPAIVSSHVGCGPDLVAEDETGWVFPAGDVAALRAALEEAVSAPARLREMGERARDRVDGFSYQVAGDVLIEVVREMRNAR